MAADGLDKSWIGKVVDEKAIRDLIKIKEKHGISVSGDGGEYESEVVEYIRKQIPNAKVISLFGSYRKGDDVNGSDIDIAVEVLGGKPFEIRELGTISQLGYRKNVKVNMHIFSSSRVDLNLFTNIANGIILDGLLEVKP